MGDVINSLVCFRILSGYHAAASSGVVEIVQVIRRRVVRYLIGLRARARRRSEERGT